MRQQRQQLGLCSDVVGRWYTQVEVTQSKPKKFNSQPGDFSNPFCLFFPWQLPPNPAAEDANLADSSVSNQKANIAVFAYFDVSIHYSRGGIELFAIYKC